MLNDQYLFMKHNTSLKINWETMDFLDTPTFIMFQNQFNFSKEQLGEAVSRYFEILIEHHEPEDGKMVVQWNELAILFTGMLIYRDYIHNRL
jgi:hypothetical protein